MTLCSTSDRLHYKMQYTLTGDSGLVINDTSAAIVITLREDR